MKGRHDKMALCGFKLGVQIILELNGAFQLDPGLCLDYCSNVTLIPKYAAESSVCDLLPFSLK